MVIILFAALAFVTDYVIIERKTRKCECAKCDATNNEVISDNTDSTQVTEENKQIWNEHYSIKCSRIENGLCFINNNDYEIVLSVNNGIEQIKIDDNVFSLNSNEKFGYVDVYSTIGIHSSSVCYYSLNYNSSDIVEKIVSYKYIGNGRIGAPIIIKKVSFSDYLEEQTGYNNCNEFLKATQLKNRKLWLFFFL